MGLNIVILLFFNKNVKTAIDVAQCRGAVLLAAEQFGVDIYEYTPLQVKQAVVGYGKAEKMQVMDMTRRILRLSEIPKPDDAADALAAAITCGFLYREDDVVEVEKFSNSRKK